MDAAGPADARDFGGRFERRLSALPSWVLPSSASGAAFAVRAWTLAEERAGNPLMRAAILDDAVYLRMADAVRTGASSGKPWFLAPLYPWVLAAASGGSAPDMASAERLSVLVGALTAAVIAAAARAMHSSSAGWIAGAAYAAAGAFVFQDVLPGQEPLLCLLHVAALFLAARWLAGGRSVNAAAVGAAVGVAVLGRSTSMALGAAFAVAAAVHARPPRRAVLGVVLAAAGCAAVLLPAALRNASAVGVFTPLPCSGGPNLYLANGPESRRDMAFNASELGSSPDVMQRRAQETAEKAEGRALGPYEASSWWIRRAWIERGDAADVASHLGRKAALFWSADEVPNNHDAAVEREWSTWLSLVPATSWWIFALGVAGWAVARRRAPSLDVAVLATAFSWAALTVFFPLARYKLPAAAAAVVLFAAGAAEILLFRATWRRAAVAAAILVVAWRTSELHVAPSRHENALRNVAFAFDDAGDRAHAEERLRVLAASDPEDGPVLVRLGRLLVDGGRAEEGLAAMRRAALDGRTRWAASAGVVHALVVMGRAAAAEAEGASLAPEAAPTPRARAEFLADLALAAHALGDETKADARLLAADSADPTAPGVVRARSALGR